MTLGPGEEPRAAAVPSRRRRHPIPYPFPTGGDAPAEWAPSPLPRSVLRILQSLQPLPAPGSRPVAILLTGLPGTGKTTFARLLREQVPLAIISTDDVRKSLFRRPTYADWEHARVFSVAYRTLAELLARGITTVFDATNLQEYLRRRVHRIAGQTGSPVITVAFETPPDTVRVRLDRRFAEPVPWDRSDATWEIHLRMAAETEPVRGWHFLVDMSADPSEAVAAVAAAVAGLMRRG